MECCIAVIDILFLNYSNVTLVLTGMLSWSNIIMIHLSGMMRG